MRLALNYSNPMAMNTWAVRRAGGVKIIGLCHGVQHSHSLIAKALGIPKQELDFTAAGINHQTWFVQVSHHGRSVLEEILPAMERSTRISHAGSRAELMCSEGSGTSLPSRTDI
ncbi:hypothetical protein RAC89_13890 [Paenibacillus sp. GD4]|uniref:family 4 glycosyl hydrolase n=1 Tax=Paenibacillus sp. GD4 TaxID=3068890 RepID=UPI0027969EB5|nr:hypothetical protein [Paenibacillus sp. GD4]MDQ1911524.1 hypothetical protein [Paenibacillus sp. GD4]